MFGRKRDKKDRKPFAVTLAELFLLVVLAVYFAKICILTVYMGQGGEGESILGLDSNLISLVLDLAMMFMTADSMLGLSSRRPKGWKKAVRGAVLLFVFTIIDALVGGGVSSLVTIDPLLLLPVVVVVIALMCTKGVRRYYVPPMEEEKPLGAWLKFAGVSDLYPAGKYRIAYDGSAEPVREEFDAEPAPEDPPRHRRHRH